MGGSAPRPVLYLHGTNDGCHGVTQQPVERVLGYAGRAVRRDTDLRRHARLLEQMHETMLDGAAPPSPPRGVVQRSWRRMRAAGRDADRIGLVEHADDTVVEERRRRSPLGLVIGPLRDSLASVAEEAGHLMVVTDADGMVLWRAGSPVIRRRADAVGFSDGVRWTEQTAGTNAIGTGSGCGWTGPVRRPRQSSTGRRPRPGCIR